MNQIQQPQPKLNATQKSQSSSFSLKQLISVVLLAVLIGVVSYGTGYALQAASKSSCSAIVGLCLFGGYVGIGVAVLVNVGLAVLGLKKIKVQNAWQIAILSTISLYSAPSFVALPSLSPVLIVGLAAALYAAVYGIYYWLFNAGKIDPTTKLAIAVVVAVLAITGSMHLSGIVSQKQYTNEQTTKIKSYDFDLYRPTYAPVGYRVYAVSPSYDDKPAPYLKVEYSYGTNEIGDPGPFTIYIFKAYDKFRPPTDCGPEHPDDILTYAFPCQSIGTDTHGNTIYKHISDFSNDYNAYIKIGDTIVAMQTTDLKFINNESLKVFQSLKPTTAEELQKIYEQDRKK